MIDYGARIRAVCDYLDTVDGARYDFRYFPVGYDNVSGRYDTSKCGCVLALAREQFHEMPEYYTQAIEWLGFLWGRDENPDDFGFIVTSAASSYPISGDESFRAAIQALRDYADKHYPGTSRHVGIPDSVKKLFYTDVMA